MAVLRRSYLWWLAIMVGNLAFALWHAGRGEFSILTLVSLAAAFVAGAMAVTR